MATVKVVCRKSSKDKHGRCPLRLRIIHKRSVKEITLAGARIKPSEWDEDKQEVRNGGMLNVRIERELLNYRQKLNEWMAVGRRVNLDELVNEVQGKKTSPARTRRVTDYIEEHFERSSELAWGTKKNYHSCRMMLLRYDKNVTLDQLDTQWLSRFDDWLKSDNGLAPWTTHTRIKVVKRVVSHALENGFLTEDRLRGFKLKRGKSQRKYVTISELKQLLNYKPVTAMDQGILRAFLFSCFTGGMRFGDLATLSYSSFLQDGADPGRIRISYVMRKTGKLVSFVLNDKSMSFLNSDLVGSSNLVFNLLKPIDLRQSRDILSKRIESSNAYSNKRLKELCKSTGLTRQFTFHEARHTFFCLGLQLGIDLISLKELGGHADVRITQEYIQLMDEQKTSAILKFNSI